jgi:hypothetical protein
MSIQRWEVLAAVLCASTLLATDVLAAEPAGAAGGSSATSVEHFHPKGKQPSTFTLELRNGLKATLPFDDKRDFDEAKKGFIAEPAYKQIKADAALDEGVELRLRELLNALREWLVENNFAIRNG